MKHNTTNHEKNWTPDEEGYEILAWICRLRLEGKWAAIGEMYGLYGMPPSTLRGRLNTLEKHGWVVSYGRPKHYSVQPEIVKRCLL